MNKCFDQNILRCQYGRINQMGDRIDLTEQGRKQLILTHSRYCFPKIKYHSKQKQSQTFTTPRSKGTDHQILNGLTFKLKMSNEVLLEARKQVNQVYKRQYCELKKELLDGNSCCSAFISGKASKIAKKIMSCIDKNENISQQISQGRNYLNKIKVLSQINMNSSLRVSTNS